MDQPTQIGISDKPVKCHSSSCCPSCCSTYPSDMSAQPLLPLALTLSTWPTQASACSVTYHSTPYMTIYPPPPSATWQPASSFSAAYPSAPTQASCSPQAPVDSCLPSGLFCSLVCPPASSRTLHSDLCCSCFKLCFDMTWSNYTIYFIIISVTALDLISYKIYFLIK